jgi:hypothetical protein
VDAEIMTRARFVVVLLMLALGLLVSGCGGGTDQARQFGRTTTTPLPATATTTVPGATSSTSTGCIAAGGTADVRADYPGRMSSLIGNDVRTGAQACVDRFVIEFQPDPKNPTSAAFPGYWVRYPSGPVTLSPSGEPVILHGGAVLLVSTGSAMQPLTGTRNATSS